MPKIPENTTFWSNCEPYLDAQDELLLQLSEDAVSLHPELHSILRRGAVSDVRFFLGEHLHGVPAMYAHIRGVEDDGCTDRVHKVTVHLERLRALNREAVIKSAFAQLRDWLQVASRENTIERYRKMARRQIRKAESLYNRFLQEYLSTGDAMPPEEQVS